MVQCVRPDRLFKLVACGLFAIEICVHDQLSCKLPSSGGEKLPPIRSNIVGRPFVGNEEDLVLVLVRPLCVKDEEAHKLVLGTYPFRWRCAKSFVQCFP